ncbi:hypothetical protein CNO14_05045 (plasmid) [Borrelia miyamotoi]|uniref:Type ISP restriction-modification enzyme LLaBIII C-terminal specificity domain-containing protein n=1 Tax=Borrelia miyamotoi TaxID=47466 RepID=A0AAQ3CMA8_9SPIR|nr:type ISP restriction/modification enzyme [Borrelia miyamotoi]ATQ15351.2 hypothetical protein CNO14_05045 [Borrelia miyamotoi]ATQ16535.2 hypothetical protein CNO13_05060 [Borrelia miyamotoi]ATQ17681.2 hypothetical protein CNO12_05055 [Borrelia miyamotoi]ATQ18867.2 hypothetical protein CNO11_04640 [Borrelia miyamotoi]ATQ20175.2 hypothetical protein CNO10_05055 [Borrelia miyamotoi]
MYYTKTKSLISRLSYKIMKHILNIDNNIGLVTTRFFATKSFKHNFVAPSGVVKEQCLSSNSINGGESYYLFPLFLIEDQKSLLESSVKTNFQENFINFINDKYHKQFESQEILEYIFVILNSKIYRNRFSKFLRVDFLIIIFADSVKNFEKLSKLGMSLINAQILKDAIKLDKNIGMSKLIHFERYKS